MARFGTVMVSLCVFVVLMMATTSLAHGRGRPGRGRGRGRGPFLPENQCVTDQPPCGTCRRPIDVTLIARNEYQEPNFEINATITKWPQQVLLSFLEQAAEANSDFKFESTYFATLGYFINSINGLRGTTENQTYWQFISLTSGESLECGVSSYVPIDNEVILFNFTTWADQSH